MAPNVETEQEMAQNSMLQQIIQYEDQDGFINDENMDESLTVEEAFEKFDDMIQQNIDDIHEERHQLEEQSDKLADQLEEIEKDTHAPMTEPEDLAERVDDLGHVIGNNRSVAEILSAAQCMIEVKKVENDIYNALVAWHMDGNREQFVRAVKDILIRFVVFEQADGGIGGGIDIFGEMFTTFPWLYDFWKKEWAYVRIPTLPGGGRGPVGIDYAAQVGMEVSMENDNGHDYEMLSDGGSAESDDDDNGEEEDEGNDDYDIEEDGDNDDAEDDDIDEGDDDIDEGDDDDDDYKKELEKCKNVQQWCGEEL